MLSPAYVAPAIDGGIRAAQQGLYGLCPGAPRDVGLTLHLAAFAGACYAVRTASDAELDVDDLHGRIERSLRDLCDDWDDRPVETPRRLFADVVRWLADRADEPQPLLDIEAVSVAVPGVASLPEPGERGDYVVGRYRRYVGAVYLYTCDPRGPETWDEWGQPGALDRALFHDVYGPNARQRAAPPGVFGAVVRHYREAVPVAAG